MSTEKQEPLCCAPEPLTEQPYGQEFWNSKYKVGETGWDLNAASPALVHAIDGISDKNAAILIPGCGNAYEADYLLEQGFTNVTLIDIAPDLVNALKARYADYSDRIRVIEGDFFAHEGEYNCILEQTFFCALPPLLRSAYVRKMYHLLASEGHLMGLLFNREFQQEGPPFGGTFQEYQHLFEPHFYIKHMADCDLSHPKRLGTELYIDFEKKCAACANLELNKK